jgi:hypothetical protein
LEVGLGKTVVVNVEFSDVNGELSVGGSGIENGSPSIFAARAFQSTTEKP